MNTHAGKTSKHKSQAIANNLHKLHSNGKASLQFAGNSLEAVAQRKLQELASKSPQVSRLRSLQKMANTSPQAKQAVKWQALANTEAASPVQQKASDGIAQLAQAPEKDELIQANFESMRRQGSESETKPMENKNGLPDKLKAGVESLSGQSLDHVKVHYNSAQPAQLNALAYAQGSDIYVAPGQEQHLPHEAWHIVQQAQGRVQPTMQMKDGVPVNDDAGLEQEADVMGAKALEPAVQRAGGRRMGDGVRRTLRDVVQKKSPAYNAINVSNGKIPLSRHHILPRASLAMLWSKTIGMYNRQREWRLQGDRQQGLGAIDIGDPPTEDEASYAPGVIWVGPTYREKGDDPGDAIEKKMMRKKGAKGLSSWHNYLLDNIASDIGDNFSVAGADRMTWLRSLTQQEPILYRPDDWESDPAWMTSAGIMNAYKLKD